MPDLRLDQSGESKKPRKRKPSRKHQNQMLELIAQRLITLTDVMREVRNAMITNLDLREKVSKEIYDDFRVIYHRCIRIASRLEARASKLGSNQEKLRKAIEQAKAEDRNVYEPKGMTDEELKSNIRRLNK